MIQKYVAETLTSGESVVHTGKFHWFYAAVAILYMVIGLWIGSADAPVSNIIMLIPIGMGIARFLTQGSTEIAITNRRLIYKHGWIRVNAEEVALDRLEEITLTQGIVGRMLGFGNVICRGVGAGNIKLPTIDQPLAFRNALQAAQDGSIR